MTGESVIPKVDNPELSGPLPSRLPLTFLDKGIMMGSEVHSWKGENNIKQNLS